MYNWTILNKFHLNPNLGRSGSQLKMLFPNTQYFSNLDSSFIQYLYLTLLNLLNVNVSEIVPFYDFEKYLIFFVQILPELVSPIQEILDAAKLNASDINKVCSFWINFYFFLSLS